VAQLLDLFAFLSVLLRAMTLAFEALTIGGVIFILVIAQKISSEIDSRLLRFCIFFSTLLAITQILFVGANSVILMNSTGLSWRE
jgi:putative copper resistance protein D